MAVSNKLLNKNRLKVGLQWILRRMRNRLRPGAAILLYHRINDVYPDPFGLCVSPANFAEHLAVLRTRAYPLTLADLVLCVRAGKIPRRAVVVTFDDGYADNLLQAKPLLSKWDVSATFFISTGLLGTQREFWWDELGSLLFGQSARDARDELSRLLEYWGGMTPSVLALARASLHPEHCDDEKVQRYLLWYHCLKQLPECSRSEALNHVRRACVSERNNTATASVMSPSQVYELQKEGLCSIGAHTVTHPDLTCLGAEDQIHEIHTSKHSLEEIVGTNVHAFSYPHGARSSITTAAVRDAGFRWACSSAADVVRRSADCHNLPRISVNNWDGDRFSDWLDGCLGC